MKKLLDGRKSLVFGAVFVFMLSLGASSASALVFQLTSDHCTSDVNPGGCIPDTAGASAGTVTVIAGTNSLTFDVALNAGYTFVNTGFPLTFAFNLNGDPTITYSALTAGFGIPNEITPPVNSMMQAAGSYHQDGTGFFEYGVLWGTQGGGAGTVGPLHFVITATGLTLNSLQQNPDGQFFAVDVRAPNGNTGNVDASTPTTNVPDGGATVTLLGSVLLGLGMLRRRFGKS